MNIQILFVLILSFFQAVSFAQARPESSDRAETSCPLPEYLADVDRRTLKGVVLIRGVLNLKGEVTGHSIVYSNADENLKTIAVENLQKCTFQGGSAENQNFTVLKKYSWNYAKYPIGIFTEQIIRMEKDCSSPQYPMVSKRLDEVGRVLLDYQLDELGYVTSLNLKNSSGFPRLDMQSIMHLVSCRGSENNSQKWLSTFYDWKLK